MGEHYDVIVIGSGPGGASLAQALAPTGKRILILERGDYLPREEANWSAKAVFVDGRYQAAETWTNARRASLHPATPLLTSAAIPRCMAQRSSACASAISTRSSMPAGFRPPGRSSTATSRRYYDAAEALFQVHGERGEDPTEPPSDTPYPYPRGEA